MTRTLNGLGFSLLLHGLILASLMSVANLPVPAPPRAIDFSILAPPPPPPEPQPIIAEEPPPAAPPEPVAIAEPPPPVRPQVVERPKPVVKPKKVALSPPKKPAPKPVEKIVEPEPQPVAESQPAEGMADIPSEPSSPVTDTAPSPPMGAVQTDLSAGAGKSGGGAQGSGSSTTSGSADIRQQYLAMVRGRIESHKNYPMMARRRQIEGRVVVRFVISPEGEVRSVEIAQSSGHESLDEAAQKAVLAASPFAKPPAQAFNGEIPLELAIVFALT